MHVQYLDRWRGDGDSRTRQDDDARPMSYKANGHVLFSYGPSRSDTGDLTFLQPTPHIFPSARGASQRSAIPRSPLTTSPTKHPPQTSQTNYPFIPISTVNLCNLCFGLGQKQTLLHSIYRVLEQKKNFDGTIRRTKWSFFCARDTHPTFHVEYF